MEIAPWVQDGRVEGHALTPSCEASESQLTAEQLSTGKQWNSTGKIPHIQRQRKSHNETVTGTQSQ